MKKVLVTGAAGSIGKNVIKYLLSEGKYEITAIDLKNKKSYQSLKKYRKRINIIYADVCDSTVMESIVKEMDYIIHLAGVMPPLSDVKSKLSYEIDYKGTENIVRLISFYNPKCHLFYASSASVYGIQDTEVVSVSTKPNLLKTDYFSNNKLEVEALIQKKLLNYTIYRLPVVLTNPIKEYFIFNFPRKNVMEVITDIDAGYMFAKSIDKAKELNKKIFNVGGGDSCVIKGKELINSLIEIYGINSRYINSLIFLDKNFYSYRFKDSDKLEKILSFRNDSIHSYCLRSKRKIKGRKVHKFIGKFIRF